MHFLREAREAEYRDRYQKTSKGSAQTMMTAIFGAGSSKQGSGGTKRTLRERQSVSRATREAAQDLELQFVSFADVTLVVSPFESGEVKLCSIPRTPFQVRFTPLFLFHRWTPVSLKRLFAWFQTSTYSSQRLLASGSAKAVCSPGTLTICQIATRCSSSRKKSCP